MSDTPFDNRLVEIEGDVQPDVLDVDRAVAGIAGTVAGKRKASVRAG